MFPVETLLDDIALYGEDYASLPSAPELIETEPVYDTARRKALARYHANKKPKPPKPATEYVPYRHEPSPMPPGYILYPSMRPRQP